MRPHCDGHERACDLHCIDQKDFGGDIHLPIASQLNHPTDSQIESLCRLGYLRGGKEGKIGGIFWADEAELTDPLHGFTQIVGHNRVEEITVRSGTHDNKIIFCDWQVRIYIYLPIAILHVAAMHKPFRQKCYFFETNIMPATALAPGEVAQDCKAISRNSTPKLPFVFPLPYFLRVVGQSLFRHKKTRHIWRAMCRTPIH